MACFTCKGSNPHRNYLCFVAWRIVRIQGPTKETPKNLSLTHAPRQHAGRGFLLGPHLVTRIPCAHPSDIILVQGVNDFARRSPGFAYENLAVMSAHESLSCSPASRMSGGDYDGDKAFIIGFQPLVSQASRILGEVEGKCILSASFTFTCTRHLGSNHRLFECVIIPNRGLVMMATTT